MSRASLSLSVHIIIVDGETSKSLRNDVVFLCWTPSLISHSLQPKPGSFLGTDAWTVRDWFVRVSQALCDSTYIHQPFYSVATGNHDVIHAPTQSLPTAFIIGHLLLNMGGCLVNFHVVAMCFCYVSILCCIDTCDNIRVRWKLQWLLQVL